MRSFLLPAAVVLALVAALMPGATENVAHAKGSPIWFTPDAGPAHEEVMVSGGMWLENAEVRLFAAFSPVKEGLSALADEFVGPFEVVTSDAEGRWEALITPDAIAGLGLSDEPGFVIVRAESDDLPRYLEGASSPFVLTVDGQRPAGSGKVEIAITFAEEPEFSRYGGYSVRSMGGDSFWAPNAVGISIPSTGRTLSIPLQDGESAVALTIGGDLEVSGPNIRQVSGETLCFGDPALCFTALRLFVLSVTVVNAEAAHADVVLRPVATVQPADLASDPLLASAPPNENGRASLIAGASVLLAILVAGAAAAGYRRATG